jgi:hypothetical protein
MKRLKKSIQLLKKHKSDGKKNIKMFVILLNILLMMRKKKKDKRKKRR